jgi:hypothetical protein
MRTLLRAGRRGVLVKIEERGQTSFMLGGPENNADIYLDLSVALLSFADVERGAMRPRVLGDRRRPLLSRLSRHFRAIPEPA